MAAHVQPDYRQGVFETILIKDGRPLELDAHLDRIGASLDALFDAQIPTAAQRMVLREARPLAWGRLRLMIAPRDNSGSLRVEVRTARIERDLLFPPPEQAISLRSHVLKDGLGAHKWVDRSALQSAEGSAPPGALLLLCDESADALEASRANIFLVAGGLLITPPLDGRILPGIARRRAIEAGREAGLEVREETVSLGSLPRADEVFLTGSLRGVESAGSLDGVSLRPGGEISERIAAAMRRRWLGASGPEFAAASEGAAGPDRRAE